MTTQRHNILLIGLLLSILAGLIVGSLVSNQAYQTLNATTQAVLRTNTAIMLQVGPCAEMCRVSGYLVGCVDRLDPCGKVRARPTSTLLPGAPTPDSIEATATAIKSTDTAVRGVAAACATLARAGKAGSCPYWYIYTRTARPKSN